MAFHNSTAQKREEQTRARRADKKGGEGDSSAIPATAKARQQWLCCHLPSPGHAEVGAGFNAKGRVNPSGAEPRSRTSEHSWVDFHCPTPKNWGFPTPYLHVHILKQPWCLSLISPLPLQPYPIFHPKRKKHKPMMLLAATTLFIFLACCDISFGACLDYLHFTLPCFTLLTMGLWPLDCYLNK